MASYRTALSLNPGRGNTHFGIGVVLLLRGDAPAAMALVADYEKSQASRAE